MPTRSPFHPTEEQLGFLRFSRHEFNVLLALYISRRGLTLEVLQNQIEGADSWRTLELRGFVVNKALEGVELELTPVGMAMVRALKAIVDAGIHIEVMEN